MRRVSGGGVVTARGAERLVEDATLGMNDDEVERYLTTGRKSYRLRRPLDDAIACQGQVLSYGDQHYAARGLYLDGPEATVPYCGTHVPSRDATRKVQRAHAHRIERELERGRFELLGRLRVATRAVVREIVEHGSIVMGPLRAEPLEALAACQEAGVSTSVTVHVGESPGPRG